jgi:hypothetical protein
MSKLQAVSLVALSLAFLASPALAQRGVPTRATHGRILDNGEEHTMCQGAPGGSRVRPNCEPDTETVEFEQEFKLAFTLDPLPTTLQCGATTTTEYQQLNTIARVTGTLEIRDCAAASGEFTVAVRTKDDSCVEKPLEFLETWQRSDDQDVSFTNDYPIGDDVELVGVRLRGLTCTCAEAPQEELPPPAEE